MKYLVFLALFAVATAEVAVFTTCEESPECTVSEVRLTPCKEKTFCRLKKGTVSAISFDFTPNFSADKLKAGLFWASDSGDVAFPDMFEADGCQYTGCPLEAAKTQTFDYSLRLGKKLPNGKYVFKMKVWDEGDKTKSCCFKTQVELRK